MSREQLAKDNGMTIEFVNWFFENKKDGCGNVWFMMMAAMWEGYQAGAASLQAERDQLAAENSYLLPKAASELSNAWVLHKYLIGIQAAIMYLDNGNKKAAQEWLYGTIAGPGFEFPDEVDDIDAWATHQMRGSISHPRALEIIKAETPATDRFLAEQRAIGIEKWISSRGGRWNGTTKEAEEFAQQLRNEVKV